MTANDPRVQATLLTGAASRLRSLRPSAGLTPLFAVAVAALALVSQNLLLAAAAIAFAVFIVRTAHLAPAMSFAVFYCILYISIGAGFF